MENTVHNAESALYLSGKLANQVQATLKATLYTLSDEMSELHRVLEAYNEYILDWAEEKRAS